MAPRRSRDESAGADDAWPVEVVPVPREDPDVRRTRLWDLIACGVISAVPLGLLLLVSSFLALRAYLDPTSSWNARPFDATEWRRGGDFERATMFADLDESERLLGPDRTQVRDLLGEPASLMGGSDQNEADTYLYHGAREELILFVSFTDGVVAHTSCFEPSD